MNKKIIQQICLSFLLVLTLVCIPVTGVQAQTQKVSIKMENVRMKQVMNEIERQTKFLFGINDDVDVNRLVTVNVTNQSLQAALDQMVKALPASLHRLPVSLQPLSWRDSIWLVWLLLHQWRFATGEQ